MDALESMGMLGVVLIAGVFTGWLWAHDVVATECSRQGSFYVGKKDFVCHLKEVPK